MFLKRLRDGTLAGWAVCAVSLSTGRQRWGLYSRLSEAVEAMHRSQARSTVVYAYLATGDELQDLLVMQEAHYEAIGA